MSSKTDNSIMFELFHDWLEPFSFSFSFLNPKVKKIILKNRVQFSSTMEKTLAGELKNLSTETRIPASKLLDEAISDLLAKYGKKFRS